jgi:N-acetylmuramoyl-L-alanine amidase
LYEQYDDAGLLALAIWREARNQSSDAQFGVGCSIRNRVQHPRWWGHDYRSVILDPWQYSSFNKNDPNSNKFPVDGSPLWKEIQELVADVIAGKPDNTNEAVSYYDKSLDNNPPKWADSNQFQHACDIGAFHFFKLA